MARDKLWTSCTMILPLREKGSAMSKPTVSEEAARPPDGSRAAPLPRALDLSPSHRKIAAALCWRDAEQTIGLR